MHIGYRDPLLFNLKMPGTDTYLTIQKRAEGSFRDRGSRFLAFVFPVRDTDEIREILAGLRRQYHDARHHCYAYRLGVSKQEYRANDDGEPSNSAGKPILGQIRSNDLTNILIVVVRYFGGKLLGVGGLINAYRSAAADALKNASIIEETESNRLSIRFPYELTSDIMKIIDEEKLKPIEQEYTETCTIQTLVPVSRTQDVAVRINKLPGASCKVFNSY
jgi:uncharacterized YigZ family protein